MAQGAELTVGIAAHAAERGGTGNCTYIRGLIRGLAGLDDAVHYVVYANDPTHPFYDEIRSHPRIRLRRLWPRHPLGRIPLALAVATYRDRVDVLHVQYVAPPVHRGALVVTVHDLAFLRIPRAFPRLQSLRLRHQVRVNARRATAVITGSEYSRRDIARTYGIPDTRVTVIQHAPDPRFTPVRDRRVLENLTRPLGIAHPYVLCVGRLNARKNLLAALEAFERIRPRLPGPVQLVMTGPRDYQADHLDRAIARSRYASDVLRVGLVTDDALAALYSGAQVLVYPSFFEGFGLPPLEAMACGTPVICSGVTSLPEVVGDAAVIIDPSSPDDIAAGLLRVLSDHALRADLSEKGLRRASRFTWRTAAERTREVYRKAARAGDRMTAP